jgi:hypothetical protein
MNRERCKTCRIRSMRIHPLCIFRRSDRVASWYSCISPLSSWAIMCILMFPAYCLAGEERLISLTVAADRTKATGKPWDGIPGTGFGGAVLNKNAPPDLAVCVVRLETPPECRMHYVNLKQYSICPNDYDCSFKRVSIPNGPFGLVILDLDTQRHDLVDFLLVTAENVLAPDQRGALESEIRRRADQLAPSPSPGDKQRRLREMHVLALDRCTEAKGCRLFQSEIHVNAAE